MRFIIVDFVIILLAVYLLVEGERQDWWEKRPYLRPALLTVVMLGCAAGVLTALFAL